MTVRYVVDSSVMARMTKPAVAAAFSSLAATVGVCAPVAFELGFSARSKADHVALMHGLDAFARVPVTNADLNRAVDIQKTLADIGKHRMLSLTDATLAAVAESRRLTVLHYDRDFETLSAVIDVAHRWIVPAGSAD